jgi:HSP20 family protein
MGPRRDAIELSDTQQGGTAMGEVMRRDLFRELEDMERRLSTWFGRAVRRREGENESLTVAEWSQLVDIEESEKEYLIKAEVPEIKKEDVKLTVQDDVLTIAGERKFEKEEKGKKYHRVERSYGSFVRSFTLPEDADGTKVSAEFKDGVLRVHLPKSEKAKPKAIEVKIS